MVPRAAAALLLVASGHASAAHIVWPPPQHIATGGRALPLSPQFAVTTPATASPRLLAAVARHAETTIGPALAAASSAAQDGGEALRELRLEVLSTDEELGMATDYSYNLTVTQEQGVVRCPSIYGCMYGLESFAQLLDAGRGVVLHSDVAIVDAPDFTWRGLMVDAGRRFFPMDTLKDLMTTMAANKLNVLHLHASDFCRFGVESKLFPNLTASLTGVKGGFYSQADIRALIALGGEMGIRIVPEFDARTTALLLRDCV